MKNKIKYVLLTLLSLLLILAISFYVWAKSGYNAINEVNDILNDKTDNIIVSEKKDYISFRPKNADIEKGFILYPGSRVESSSYSMLCRDIAKNGYKVVIAKMPLNLSILNKDKADYIMKEFPEIDKWVIGGHSLGGVMASDFSNDNGNIKGLVLLGSYPASDYLKDDNLKTISIYGTKDTVCDLNKIKNAPLPSGSKLLSINGANHANFGQYGVQDNDSEADISAEEQIRISVNYIVELLKEV